MTYSSTVVSELKLGKWFTSNSQGFKLASSITSKPSNSKHKSGSLAWQHLYMWDSYGWTVMIVLIIISVISAQIYAQDFLTYPFYSEAVVKVYVALPYTGYGITYESFNLWLELSKC